VLDWQFSPPEPVDRDTQIMNMDGYVIRNRALFTHYAINIDVESNPGSAPAGGNNQSRAEGSAGEQAPEADSEGAANQSWPGATPGKLQIELESPTAGPWGSACCRGRTIFPGSKRYTDTC
jgi:hypothetical protein